MIERQGDMFEEGFHGGWIAGILEGEGSFSSSWSTYGNRSGKNGPYWKPRVVASSTDRFVVDRLQLFLGGRIHTVQPKGISKQEIFTWQLGKRETILWLCKELRPYMSPRRRDQIDKILADEKVYNA